MLNVSDKIYRENQNTFLFNSLFLETRAICEKMWGNFVDPDGPQTTLWRRSISYFKIRFTDTHSEYAFASKISYTKPPLILLLYIHFLPYL